jgi:hypothetical protein
VVPGDLPGKMRFLRIRIQILNNQKISRVNRSSDHFDQYFALRDFRNGNIGKPENVRRRANFVEDDGFHAIEFF